MRTIVRFMINIGVFWVITELIPGISFKYGITSKMIGGAVFAMTMVMVPGVIRFFKFKASLFLKIIAGIVVNFVVWLLINNNTNFILSFGESYIGGGDFIIFTLPKMVVLTNVLVVIFFTAMLMVLCSIILEKFRK